MSFRSFEITPNGTSSVLVYRAQCNDVEVWVRPTSARDFAYFIGAGDVTDQNGYPLAADSTEHFHSHVKPGDELYTNGSGDSHTGNLAVLVRSI